MYTRIQQRATLHPLPLQILVEGHTVFAVTGKSSDLVRVRVAASIRPLHPVVRLKLLAQCLEYREAFEINAACAYETLERAAVLILGSRVRRPRDYN